MSNTENNPFKTANESSQTDAYSPSPAQGTQSSIVNNGNTGTQPPSYQVAFDTLQTSNASTPNQYMTVPNGGNGNNSAGRNNWWNTGGNVAVKSWLWFLAVANILVGGIIGALLGIVLYHAVIGSWGISMTTTGGMNIEPGVMTVASAFTLLFSSLAVFFLPKVGFAKRFLSTHDGLGLTKQDKGVWLKAGIGLVAGIAFFGVLQLMGLLASLVGHNLVSSDTSISVISMITDPGVDGPLGIVSSVIILLSTCIITPLAEEIAMRGLVGRALVDSSLLRSADGSRTGLSTFMVCLISGVVFGVLHITAFNFASLIAFVTTALLGTLLTWLSSVWSRSILPSFACHAAYNTIGIVLSVISVL